VINILTIVLGFLMWLLRKVLHEHCVNVMVIIQV